MNIINSIQSKAEYTISDIPTYTNPLTEKVTTTATSLLAEYPFIPASQPQIFTDPQMLRKELVLTAPHDQQNLLETVSTKELQAIQNCFNHPRMERVVKNVLAGEWEQLIALAQQEPEIYHILEAAYCQGKLGQRSPESEGIDNLATAWIFIGPAMAGQKYTLHSFDEVAQNKDIWGDISSRWNRHDIPANQRYFILVEANDIADESAEYFMRALHDDLNRDHHVAGGLCYHDYRKGWALGSASLIRKDRLLKGHNPIFGRGLRSIKTRFDHLLGGSVEVGLHKPGDTRPKTVHGVNSQGNLLTTHDCYHAVQATNRIFDYPELLHLGEKIDQLFQNKVLPPYSKNAKVQTFAPTSFYAFLTSRDKNALLTEDDWVRFLLFETIIAIQDGEAAYYATHYAGKTLDNILKNTIADAHNRQTMWGHHFNTQVAHIPKFEELKPRIRFYLEQVGIDVGRWR